MSAYDIKPYIVEPVRGLDARGSLGDALQSGLWFAPSLRMAPLSARRCVVTNAFNDALAELSSGEYAVLTACEGCRTLAEHEEHAARKLSAPMEHRPAFRELLERCAQRGLLMAVPDLVNRFGVSSTAEPQPIRGVVIRTADRPELLGRLLSSAATLEARTGCRRRWVVIDDSHEETNELANRAILDRFTALDTEHFDHAAAADLRRGLRSEFPRFEREIEWLLAPGSRGETTAGVAINHALLRFAGQAFVFFDDDAIIDPRRPAVAEAGFAVSGGPDELFLYETEAALWRDSPAFDIDPIAEHGRWLGLPMAQAWRLAEQQAGALAEMAFDSNDVPRFGAEARILFTHNQACGDPGSSMLPIQLFAMTERSRRWLAGQPHAAEYAFASRTAWRGQTRLTLSPRRDLTFTTLSGIDDTRLLPPAARNHRSTDLLLGLTAQRMYPASWVAELPFSLPHLRDPPKNWIGSSERFMQEPLHVLMSVQAEHALRLVGSSAERSLEAMAMLLLDLAAATEARLRDVLLQHAIETGGRALFLIQEQLDDATLPAAWRSALQPWLQSPALKPENAHERILQPSAFRTLLEAYGQAMLAWPPLWNRSRERNA